MSDRGWFELPDVWIVAGETIPGFWVVSFYPRRRDDPDYPGFTITSSEHTMPTEEGLPAVVAWAERYWEALKERRS